jgi:hypothetical protein
VLAAGAAGDVGVLAHLDVPVGAEDGEARVAPGVEAVGREPVDADVAGAAVAAHERVAEVVEVAVVGVAHVAHLRRHDLRLGGAVKKRN